MLQSWAVIGLGLSVFALSPYPPTQRFGALMLVLLTVALVGNLVLLPALLSGRLGEAFARRIQRAGASRGKLIPAAQSVLGLAHADTPAVSATAEPGEAT